MAPLRVRLGRMVRQLRAAAGFSQEKFAAEIKLHRTFMGSIERGKTNVSLDTLERLARGLRMSVWELLRAAETGVSVLPESRDSSRKSGGYPRRGRSPSGDRKVAEDRDR
jgi:transcriptional regulator with XRE-family HTH domain